VRAAELFRKKARKRIEKNVEIVSRARGQQTQRRKTNERKSQRHQATSDGNLWCVSVFVVVAGLIIHPFRDSSKIKSCIVCEVLLIQIPRADGLRSDSRGGEEERKKVHKVKNESSLRFSWFRGRKKKVFSVLWCGMKS
jgi:hypothetical protein